MQLLWVVQELDEEKIFLLSQIKNRTVPFWDVTI